MRFVVIAVVFFLAVGTLITVGVLNRGTPVVTFQEILAASPDSFDSSTDVKVQRGRVVEIVSLAPDLRFRYGDPEDPASAILVKSDRNAPDNFRIGIGATLRGTYDCESRVFHAKEVATNCPTKYDPAEDLKGMDGKKSSYETYGAKPKPKADVPSGSAP